MQTNTSAYIIENIGQGRVTPEPAAATQLELTWFL